MGKININGAYLYYEEMGQGEPVMLLNGIFMSTKSWYFESGVLSKKYRVILHDFRGQWQSEKPEGKYTFEIHADDLYQLVKKLNLSKINLIGTSYGGEVAMAFAIKYGELLKSLAIITSVSEIDLRLKITAERWKNAVKTSSSEIFINEWLGDTYSENFLENNLEAIYPKLVEAFKIFDFKAGEKLIDCFLSLYKNPLTPDLHKITIPTVVIAAELDTLKPPVYSRIINNRIKNSEFHIIQNSGHAAVIEKPEEINTILLGFLDKVKIIKSE
jgi:3-oxoadipate enol-lactonase